jgi:hypothetical protein
MNPAAPVTTMYTVALLQFEVDRATLLTTNGTRGATAQRSSYPTVDAACAIVVTGSPWPQSTRTADACFGTSVEIDGDQVHRHAARERAFLAADEHRRAVGRVRG